MSWFLSGFGLALKPQEGGLIPDTATSCTLSFIFPITYSLRVTPINDPISSSGPQWVKGRQAVHGTCILVCVCYRGQDNHFWCRSTPNVYHAYSRCHSETNHDLHPHPHSNHCCQQATDSIHWCQTHGCQKDIQG